MTQWCESKAFREDYEKRILTSLNSRQLSRDGRMRNPDEKPIFIESQAPAPEPEPIPVKLPAKQAKEVPAPQADDAPKIEARSKGPVKSHKAKAALDADDDYEAEPPKEKAKPTEADVAKLKEIKRQEEIEKNKLALERKKRQAEKQQAKAAARAQKEAEKKLKVLLISHSPPAIYTVRMQQLTNSFRKRRRKPRRNLVQLTLMSPQNRMPSLMKPWKPQRNKK